MRVAVLQSSYIPWKGFFDILAASDLFVWLDDVQYTRRDWRSRNRIKTANGPKWLTIPVSAPDHRSLRISDVTIADPGWVRSHLGSIEQAYAASPHFDAVFERLSDAYAAVEGAERLVDVDRSLVAALADLLDIRTPTVCSTDLLSIAELDALGPSERILALVQAAGADRYLSGPAARTYLDAASFHDAAVTLEFADYNGYPTYDQLHGPFEHAVSVVDLLVHTGAAARDHLKLTRIV